MKELSSKLVANTAANFAGQAVLMLLTFFTTPYIIHHFGDVLYGVLILLMTFVLLFTLLELGINTSLVKYMAEELPQKRVEEINGYLGTALALFACAGAAVAILSASAAPWIVTHLMKLPPQHYEAAVFGIRIASAAFVLQFISTAFASVPIAAQRFDLVNAIDVATESTRVLGWVAVIYFGFLLKAVLFVTFVASVFRLVAYAIAACRLVPGLTLWPRFSRAHFHSIIHFSKFVVVSRISSRLAESADKLIISYFFPVAYLSFYAVPYGLGQKLWVLVGNVTTVVFPAASELSTGPSKWQLRGLYLRSSKIVAAIVTFPALILCLFGREILSLWIGPEFAVHGTIVLRLLSVGFALNAWSHVANLVSQAVGRPEISARYSCIYVVINLILALILIPPFGILGAAISFLGTQLALIPWFIGRVGRLLDVGWRDVLSKSYRPVLVTSAVAALMMVPFRAWITSLWTLVAFLNVAGVIYLVLAQFFVLDARERSTCWGLVNGWLATLRLARAA